MELITLEEALNNKLSESGKGVSYTAQYKDRLGNIHILVRTTKGTLVFKTSKGISLSVGDSGISPGDLELAKKAKSAKEFLKIINKGRYTFELTSDPNAKGGIEKDPKDKFDSSIGVQYTDSNRNTKLVYRTKMGNLEYRTSKQISLSISSLRLSPEDTEKAKKAKTAKELAKILNNALPYTFTELK